jgi:serine protease Do
VKSLRLVSHFILLILALVLVACGGDEEGAEATIEPAATVAVAEATTAPVEPTTAVEPTAAVEPTPSGPMAAASFQEAIGATVQIVAQGSFMDPEFGMQYNSAGAGTGFIIDPSGVAVTNNHVVTGAAFLQV